MVNLHSCPIPPPNVRPSVKQDNGQRMEDDLTHKICDIVKTNRSLKQKYQPVHLNIVSEEWSQLLQYHVSTFIDNQIPGIPAAAQRSGRPLNLLENALNLKKVVSEVILWVRELISLPEV